MRSIETIFPPTTENPTTAIGASRSPTTTMASLSLVVVAMFAAALSAISVRVFARAALH